MLHVSTVLQASFIELPRTENFTIALYGLLFEDGELKIRFNAFIHVFEEIKAANWPTATNFLFILEPDKYMFVKPTVTQFATEICKFEINYKPQPNWLTYKSVLDFSLISFILSRQSASSASSVSN